MPRQPNDVRTQSGGGAKGRGTLAGVHRTADGDGMSAPSPSRLPSGTSPWDVFSGIRVGVVAGGLTGAVLTLVAGWSAAWTVPAVAVLGGAVGYVTEKRRRTGST